MYFSPGLTVSHFSQKTASISICNISPLNTQRLFGLYKRLVCAFNMICTFVQKLVYLFKSCYKAGIRLKLILIFATKT